jgi:hypothetical protein
MGERQSRAAEEEQLFRLNHRKIDQVAGVIVMNGSHGGKIDDGAANRI